MTDDLDPRLFEPGLLHHPTRPNTPWTRVNVGEAVPGILTPFDWTFIGPNGEAGGNLAFWMLGVYSKKEIELPARPEDRSSSVFFGRLASNIDRMRTLGDRVPGLSGDGIERQYFGGVREGVRNEPAYARYPMVLVKGAVALRRMPDRLRSLRAATNTWWSESVASGALEDPAVARSVLQESVQRYRHAMAEHIVCALSTIGMYDTVYRICEAAGMPGAETKLIGSLGDLEETAMIDDLFDVAEGVHTIEWFLGRHGYHGELEGAPSGRSWREVPQVVESLIDGYQRSDRASIRKRREEAAAAAAETTRAVLAALPARKRLTARANINRALKNLPWREVGKAAFVQCVDVARAAARSIGASMVADRRLAEIDDIFLLTVDEVVGDHTVPPTTIEERREMLRLYASVEIAESFIGEPVPTLVHRPSERDVTAAPAIGAEGISGFGVSSGTITGPARVILEDERDTIIEPGDILVCPMTDPSWAPFLALASALVVDIGGPLSHAAIIAREMGVPCVINTQIGTKAIRTGDLIEVDGDAGTVKVLRTAL